MRYLLPLLLLCTVLCAQKKTNWDTTRYQKFRSTLMVGIFQSYRNFDNNFKQFTAKDTLGVSSNNYVAESQLTTGIEISYDKFSFGFAVKSTPQKNSTGKGNTRTFNTNLNFGGNKWYL